MRQRWQTLVVLVTIIGAGLIVQTACSGTEAQVRSLVGEERTISVSGGGTVSAEPDEVVLRLGVEAMAETASAALSENSRQMQAVIGALKEAGIPAADIQTQTVDLRPEYETPEREATLEGEREARTAERQLVGYVASNIVEASSEDLDAVGELLDAAVQAGANRVEDIRFEVDNPADLLEQAREAAWDDAEQKARELADLAGVTLGEVLSVNESTRAPRPVGLVREVEMEAAVPIEPGREQIQVDVQVTWSLR